jgi:spore coat polysaccharide biosynthesis predicted glycosyltransferase SpsG
MLAATCLALWQAQRQVQAESPRAAVKAQLQCAYERLNDAAVQERARERHAGRHASHALSQAEVEAGEALLQRMLTKAGARIEDAGEPEDASLMEWR